MPTFIRDYRPGRAVHDRGRVQIERPSYDVTAVFSDEADDVFGVRGLTERIDWAQYLEERGLLLRTQTNSLMSRVRVAPPDERGVARKRWAYVLLCEPDAIPRKRPRRERRVYTW